jgi:molybdate transport system substrate-binding protein
MLGNKSLVAHVTMAAVYELVATVGPAASQTQGTLVFAAASLKNALDDIAAQWQRQTSEKIAISYAARNNSSSRSS